MATFECTRCDLRVLDSDEEWEFLERFGACPRCKAKAPGVEAQEQLDLGPTPQQRAEDRAAERQAALPQIENLRSRLVLLIVARVAVSVSYAIVVAIILWLAENKGPDEVATFLHVMTVLTAATVGLAVAQFFFAWRLAGLLEASPVLALIAPLALVGYIAHALLIRHARRTLRSAPPTG